MYFLCRVWELMKKPWLRSYVPVTMSRSRHCRQPTPKVRNILYLIFIYAFNIYMLSLWWNVLMEGKNIYLHLTLLIDMIRELHLQILNFNIEKSEKKMATLCRKHVEMHFLYCMLFQCIIVSWKTTSSPRLLATSNDCWSPWYRVAGLVGTR